MITTIICIGIYLLSTFAMFSFTQIAHYHPKGIWRHIPLELVDVFITFFPGINTVAAIICWVSCFPIKNTEYRETNIFKPKNKWK